MTIDADWQPEPPLFPANESITDLPPYSEEKGLSLLLTRPAARKALVVLALMPEEGAPWPWVEELAADRGARLELEGSGLAVTLSGNPVARLHPEIAAQFTVEPDGAEGCELRRAARELAARRLKEIRDERWRRFNILKAEGRDPTPREPGLARTSSKASKLFAKHGMRYVSEAGEREARRVREESQRLAAVSHSWPDYGLWELPYVHAFIRDEVLRGDLEGLEWVLSLSSIPEPLHQLAREPVDRLLKNRPDGWEELRLKCLYLFEEGARRSRENPYCRGGWYPLREALEMLREARPRYPNSPEFEELWMETCNLYELYDW